MSLTHHEVSPKQVAANQQNAQKSTGPKTPEGKARAALNSIKHGAYAKADNSRRQIMLHRGQDPTQYEQLHQDLVDSWQPDDAMQAMILKTVTDRTWDKLQLRQAWLDRQLASTQLEQTLAHRRQLAARRWLRGVPPGGDRGLCGAEDSPQKFVETLELLGRLEGWFGKETCPDEYPEVMNTLYGDFLTVAGARIRELFIQLFDDDPGVCEKARQEFPRWIAQEKGDVQYDRELYHRELSLRRSLPGLSEEQVAAKEAGLDRQIREQTRLLLQLKSKRSLWGSEPEAETEEPGASANQGVESSQGAVAKGDGTFTGEKPVPPGKESSQEPITRGDGTGATEGVSAEKDGQNGQTKPLDDVESMT